MPTGWVFRLEIVSEKTPYTKEVTNELHALLESSQVIDRFLIEEMPSEIVKLFKKKEMAP